MKNYVSPKMELVVVDIIDVITTSGELMKKIENEYQSDWIFRE